MASGNERKNFKSNLDFGKRLPFDEKAGKLASQFAKMSNHFCNVLKDGDRQQMLFTVLLSHPDLAKIYYLRWKDDYPGDELREFPVPVTGQPTSSFDKLSKPEEDPFEQKLRTQVLKFISKKGGVKDGSDPSLSTSSSSYAAPSTTTRRKTGREEAELLQRAIEESQTGENSEDQKKSELASELTELEPKLKAKQEPSTPGVKGIKSLVSSAPAKGSSGTKLPGISEELADMLGLSIKETKEAFILEGRFIDVSSWKQETENVRPDRVKAWLYLRSCLMLPSDEKLRGPFSYLIDSVALYDVAALYKAMKTTFSKVSYMSATHDMMDFYLTCTKMINEKVSVSLAHEQLTRKLEEFNESVRLLDTAHGGIFEGLQIPKGIISVVIIEIAHKQPAFNRMITEYLLNKDLNKMDLQPAALVQHMAEWSQNQSALDSRQSYQIPGSGGKASRARGEDTESKEKDSGKMKKGACKFNWNGETCKHQPCAYKHFKPEPETGSDSQGAASSTSTGKKKGKSKDKAKGESKDASSHTCNRCGNPKCEKGDSCRALEASCGWCRKKGHFQNVCLGKKRGDPQVPKAERAAAAQDGPPGGAPAISQQAQVQIDPNNTPQDNAPRRKGHQAVFISKGLPENVLRERKASRAIFIAPNPATEHRPKSAMNGVRVGEASHPGPSTPPNNSNSSSSPNNFPVPSRNYETKPPFTGLSENAEVEELWQDHLNRPKCCVPDCLQRCQELPECKICLHYFCFKHNSMFCPARHSVDLSTIAQPRDSELSSSSSTKRRRTEMNSSFSSSSTGRKGLLDSIQSGGANGLTGILPPPPLDEQGRYSPITTGQITEGSPLNQVLPDLRSFVDYLLPATARMPLKMLDTFWAIRKDGEIDENPHHQRIKMLAKCNKLELHQVFEVFGENLCERVLQAFDSNEEEVAERGGTRADVINRMYNYFTSDNFVNNITHWGEIHLGRAHQWATFNNRDNECSAWPFGETTTLEVLLSRNKRRLTRIFGDAPEDLNTPWPSREMQHLLKYIFGDHLNRIYRGFLDPNMPIAEGLMLNCISFAREKDNLSLEYGLWPYRQESEKVLYNIDIKIKLIASSEFTDPNEVAGQARAAYYGRATWPMFIQTKIASQRPGVNWTFVPELETDAANIEDSRYLAGVQYRATDHYEIEEGADRDQRVLANIPWERHQALVRNEGSPYRRGSVAFEEMTVSKKVTFLNLMLTRIANFFHGKDGIFIPSWDYSGILDNLRRSLYDLYHRVTGTIRKATLPDARGEEDEKPLTRLEVTIMIQRFLSNDFPILPGEVPILGLDNVSGTDYALQEEELVRRADERNYDMHMRNLRNQMSVNELAKIFEPEYSPCPEPTYSPCSPERDTGDGGGEERVLVSNIAGALEELMEAGLVAEHRPTSHASGSRIGEASHPGPLLQCDQCSINTDNKCDMCKIRGLCIECEKNKEYCTSCAPAFASYNNAPFRECISCKSSTQHWCSKCEKDGQQYFLGVQLGRPYCHRCFSDHPHCPVCSPEPKRRDPYWRRDPY